MRTAFTLSLVERRLEEYDIHEDPTLRPVKPKDIVEIGPFKVEFVHVTHSIVSCVALAITTPLGVIIHTGDFKVDPTPTDNELFDLHTLADYGKRGVLLLLSDSTNADRPGYSDSERAVRPRLEDVFNRSESRLFVSCFSSSIHRLQQIINLSEEFGRKVALVGRSMIAGDGDRPQPRLPRNSRQHPDAAAGCDDREAVESNGADFGHAGRADVGALARGRRQSQEHFDHAGRHGGAEFAHHSGQREDHLPHDRPPFETRRRRAVWQHESAAARFRARVDARNCGWC